MQEIVNQLSFSNKRVNIIFCSQLKISEPRELNLKNPIDFYYWPTPNGWKVSIALEEMQLPYETKLVNINKGDQFKKDFLKISPNNRIPAITDYEGPKGEQISLFESGAILHYLALKTSSYLGNNDADNHETVKWLMWQMGGLGPMAGQAHHFLRYAPNMTPSQDIPYAKNRYKYEVKRLYQVLETNLGGRDFVAGNFFSIADMAIWPWISLWRRQDQNIDLFPNIKSWSDRCKNRTAVQKGRDLLKQKRSNIEEDKNAHEILFNQPKV